MASASSPPPPPPPRHSVYTYAQTVGVAEGKGEAGTKSGRDEAEDAIAMGGPVGEATTSSVGPYQILQTIGVGTYGCVKKAVHRLAAQEVAIKIIKKEKLDRDGLQKIYREIEVQKRLDHPFIIKVLQVMETREAIYIVTELANRGELFAHIRARQRLPEREARGYFWQVVSAVAFCHKRGIVHRDIKAENLLVDETCTIKLADFGFSNFYQESELLKTYCGSPPYAAPEIFQGIAYHGEKIDVWSLGVLLYVFIVGRSPFDGKSLAEVRHNVLLKPITYPFYISAECTHLLMSMLTRDSSKRLSLAQVMKHKWMKMDDAHLIVDKQMDLHAAVERCLPYARITGIMEDFCVAKETVRECIDTHAFNNVDGLYRVLLVRWKQKKMRALMKENVMIEAFVAAETAIHGSRAPYPWKNGRIDGTGEIAEKVEKVVDSIDVQRRAQWEAAKAATDLNQNHRDDYVDERVIPEALTMCGHPDEYPNKEFANYLNHDEEETVAAQEAEKAALTPATSENGRGSSEEQGDDSTTPVPDTCTPYSRRDSTDPEEEEVGSPEPAPFCTSKPPTKLRDPRMDSIESSEGYATGTGDGSEFSTVPGSLSSVAEEGLRRIPSDVSRKMDEMSLGQKRAIAEEEEEEETMEGSSQQPPLPKRPSLPECLAVDRLTGDSNLYRPKIPVRQQSHIDGLGHGGKEKKVTFRLRAQMMKRHARKARIESDFKNKYESSTFLPPPSLVEGGSFDDDQDTSHPSSSQKS